MNAWWNRELIQALFRASHAGVFVDLIVRGVCCLRPGVPGVSENIRVRSIIGRFLEHSRVLLLPRRRQEDVFCASADWMHRNLFRRVELMFPVLDPRLKQRLMVDLDTYLADNTQAWELQAGGQYLPLSVEGEDTVNAQRKLLQQFAESH